MVIRLISSSQGDFLLQLGLGKIFCKCMGIQGKQAEIRCGAFFVLVYVNIQDLIIEILEKEGKDFFYIRSIGSVFGFFRK